MERRSSASMSGSSFKRCQARPRFQSSSRTRLTAVPREWCAYSALHCATQRSRSMILCRKSPQSSTIIRPTHPDQLVLCALARRLRRLCLWKSKFRTSSAATRVLCSKSAAVGLAHAIMFDLGCSPSSRSTLSRRSISLFLLPTWRRSAIYLHR